MKKLAALAIATMAPFAFGQQPPNTQDYHVYDGSTEYTSRLALGSEEGEILNRVPKTHFGNLGKALGIGFCIQDQNDSTVETYYYIIRLANAKGEPDMAPSAVVYQEGPYFTPKGTGSVRAWWNQYRTFKKPVSLPRDKEFFFGLHFSKVSSKFGGWPKDGGSVHMSGMYPNQNNGTQDACGEHFRYNIKDTKIAWNVQYKNGKPSFVISAKDNGRVFNIKLFIDNPILQPFAIDPIGGAPKTPCAKKKNFKDFGLAGLWPDLTDLEKYGYKAKFGWRLKFKKGVGSGGFVFFASKMLPVAMPTPYGFWYLLPSDRWFTILVGFPVTLDTAGNGDTPSLDPPNAMRNLMVGMYLYAQAVVIDMTTKKAVLSNWSGVSY